MVAVALAESRLVAAVAIRSGSSGRVPPKWRFFHSDFNSGGDGGAASGSPNRTPTGLAALKVKPSAAQSTMASNCSVTWRAKIPWRWRSSGAAEGTHSPEIHGACDACSSCAEPSRWKLNRNETPALSEMLRALRSFAPGGPAFVMRAAFDARLRRKISVFNEGLLRSLLIPPKPGNRYSLSGRLRRKCLNQVD